MDFTNLLFEHQDLGYKAFHSKLMPNIDIDLIVGVRIPQIRKIACDYKDYADGFLSSLPHRYYEENNLHGFFICNIKDYDKCIYEINRFLPYVDNWATCDSLRPKCFAKNKEKLLSEIKKWIKSGETYTIRFAIEMLMVHFLDEDFSPEFIELVSGVSSNEYYVNMMIAWYFATALAKQWDDTVWYLENKKLPVWIHNKTIQKAVESYRVSEKSKKQLKKLKI